MFRPWSWKRKISIVLTQILSYMESHPWSSQNASSYVQMKSYARRSSSEEVTNTATCSRMAANIINQNPMIMFSRFHTNNKNQKVLKMYSKEICARIKAISNWVTSFENVNHRKLKRTAIKSKNAYLRSTRSQSKMEIEKTYVHIKVRQIR